uniref:Uncharacterized protein n=1 Tax=Rhizophora mucronata TaxID=61149 RepID=A0A2P2QE48_RHIMU
MDGCWVPDIQDSPGESRTGILVILGGGL